MTWIQTASGRAFDILHPAASAVDFGTDVPDALARLARFTGHIAAGPYSVAQHSVHCCDVVLGETGDYVAAAYALIHDAKEAYIGDWATPLKLAVEEVCQSLYGTPALAQVLGHIDLGVDVAVHVAAGLPYRRRPADIIKSVDLRMLQAERLQLLNRARGQNPRWPWDDAPPRSPRIALSVWPWPQAADAFRERLNRVVPEARRLIALEAEPTPAAVAPRRARKAPTDWHPIGRPRIRKVPA